MATTTTPQNDWDKKELGVLWKRETKGTKESYLTGTLNLKALGFDKDVPVICFKNKRKTKDTHPDIRIYISEKKADAPKGKTASAPAPAAAPENELI